MSDVRNLDTVFASIPAVWLPHVIATVNDYDVKLALAEGDHTWHVHDTTDEFFLVLDGELTLDLPDDRSVRLGPGDSYVVPAGTPHFPQAAPGTKLMLIEPNGTVSTGDGDGAAHLVSTTGVDVDADDDA